MPTSLVVPCRKRQWRIQGGGERDGHPPPALTGCILKHVKILHENALFLHNFKKIFSSDPTTILKPPIRISGSTTGRR